MKLEQCSRPKHGIFLANCVKYKQETRQLSQSPSLQSLSRKALTSFTSKAPKKLTNPIHYNLESMLRNKCQKNASKSEFHHEYFSLGDIDAFKNDEVTHVKRQKVRFGDMVTLFSSLDVKPQAFSTLNTLL